MPCTYAGSAVIRAVHTVHDDDQSSVVDRATRLLKTRPQCAEQKMDESDDQDNHLTLWYIKS